MSEENTPDVHNDVKSQPIDIANIAPRLSGINNYDLVADLYDFEFPECFGAELEFWDGMAQEAGGPLLELAVGSGRVAIPLARMGHSVWGIDVSNRMLDRAKLKAAQLPKSARSRLHLLRRDMTDFDLGRRFGLIYCPFNGFLLMEAGDPATKCLERVKRHLRPGGRFVIDAFAMSPWDAEPDVEELTFLERHPLWGAQVSRRRVYSFDADTRRALTRLEYRLEGENAPDSAIVMEYTLQLYDKDALYEQVKTGGFRVVEAYGGYGKQIFEVGMDNMILVTEAVGASD